MKQVRLEKEQIPPLATSIITWRPMDLEKLMLTYTLTKIVQGKIKTICYFLWYLVWRIINKLHHSINYSFLIAGHTKFGPDRCFGVIKQAFKVNFTLSTYEFAWMVDCSSTTGVNKAQFVGTHDSREIVPVYDWATFLSQFFTKLLNIKKYHHFRLSMDEPGKIYFKEYRSSPEHSLMVLKDPAVMPPLVLPCRLHPEGFSMERKEY